MMRLFALTLLTMVAFAANSVLNRLALEAGDTGPASFAAIRLISGVVMLAGLVVWRDKGTSVMRGAVSWQGPASLALYVLGFSFAYVTLDAGVGALILFGGVQITMFTGALIARENIPVNRWIGAVMAFGGLVWLMWPRQGAGDIAPNGIGAALMALAALGWGIYSLIGRRVGDPLAATATNFALAAPLGLLVWVLVPDVASWQGVGLAMVSGMVTSGLGYALWYRVLPELPAAIAAIAQLSVPVIAVAGGVVFLSEAPDIRFALATALVMGGVFVSLLRPRRA
jgi:drug/metabolite transporter (DMT)-like permease